MTTNNATPVAIDEETVKNDLCEDEIEVDPRFDPSSCVEEHLLKRLRKEFNCEALNHDLDEKVTITIVKLAYRLEFRLRY